MAYKDLWFALRHREFHGRMEVQVIAAFEYQSGVLEGRIGTRYIDRFDTEEEALAAYPQAAEGYVPPPVSVAHLPGEDDPVPGGMYPDDYDDSEPVDYDRAFFAP